MSDNLVPNAPARPDGRSATPVVDPVAAYAKKLEGLNDKQLAGEIRRRVKSGERLFLTSVLDIVFNSPLKGDRAYIK